MYSLYRLSSTEVTFWKIVKEQSLLILWRLSARTKSRLGNVFNLEKDSDYHYKYLTDYNDIINDELKGAIIGRITYFKLIVMCLKYYN